MKVHVNKLASICYYHLRRLFQLRSFVSQDVMKHLVTALVLAHIDSCNSVLVNLPASTIAPLQRVRNTAARLVLGLKRRAHITPALKKLHWILTGKYVRQRITFKIATLVHGVQRQDCPPYLCDLVHFANADCNRSRLRSATSGAATVVRTRTNLGQRAFSVAACRQYGTASHRHCVSLNHILFFADNLKHICLISHSIDMTIFCNVFRLCYARLVL